MSADLAFTRILFKYHSTHTRKSQLASQRNALGKNILLLRLSQELLQLFRYAGLKRNDRVYCIYNNDLEVHSYVENT